MVPLLFLQGGFGQSEEVEYFLSVEKGGHSRRLGGVAGKRNTHIRIQGHESSLKLKLILLNCVGNVLSFRHFHVL